MATAEVISSVHAVMPGSRVARVYQVTRTHDGKLKFRSDRSIGIFDPKKNVCWYSSRGNSEVALRRKARKVEITQQMVKAFDKAANLSDRAKQRLLSK